MEVVDGISLKVQFRRIKTTFRQILNTYIPMSNPQKTLPKKAQTQESTDM